MEPRWRGAELKLSKSAYRELFKLDMDMFDVLDILENGYDCARSKRKEGTYEVCMRRGNKTYKAVVVESVQQWDNSRVWLVIHAGVMR